MRGLSVCFDFSNMCYRALFTCKYGNPDIVGFDTQEECDIFARKVITDMVSVTKMFNANFAYVFVDSKNPWRKEVCENYKGTRNHDSTVNFNNVYKTMDEILNILKEKNFFILNVDKGEADDMAALLKHATKNNCNQSFIYVSSDADWLQLVDFDDTTKQFYVVYNPIAGGKGCTKLQGTDSFIQWINFSDSRTEMFSDYLMTKRKIVDAIATNPKITMISINPTDILINKIMLGDDGDNVPAFFSHYKKGRRVRITETKLAKIKESCGGFENLEELTNVAKNGSLVESIGKVMKTDVSSLDGTIRLDLQRKSVELNPSLFPTQIVEDFIKQYNDICNTLNSGNIAPLERKMENIVEGTKFEKKNYKPNNAHLNKIFAGVIDKPITSINELF